MSSNSKTSLVHFAVIQHAFPGRMPGVQVESPTARRFTSLETSSDWVRSFGHPMHVQAFISVEILNDRLSERSLQLIERYMGGSPDQLILLVKDPVIGLVNKLLNQEASGNDEIENLEFEILDIAGSGDTIPGMYAESVHDADIASSIERWSKNVDGLPVFIIGHVSIEVYRNKLLPDALSAIESKDRGEPESLEALIGGAILDIIKRFVTA